MTTPADILAVQRAYASGGRAAAQIEIRRRWPVISDTALPATLDHILAAPIEPPPPFRGQGEPALDGRRRAMRGKF
ncbi:MAG: hypothetical protein WCJ64_13160 [Rhodospirillaceae bacterium]